MNIIRFLGFQLKTIRGKTIVHVGAHYGEEADRYRFWGAKRVVWFEAAPSIFEKLQAHLKTVSQKGKSKLAALFGEPACEQIACLGLLGEESGRVASFHQFNNEGASNSIFQLSDKAHDMFAGLQETGDVLQLEMTTLDDELEKRGIAPQSVDILVIDVQGAELMVLKGALKTLKAAKYLECEVSREPIYEGGVLLAELETWLNQYGFYRKTSIRRSHMNAIFVRKD